MTRKPKVQDNSPIFDEELDTQLAPKEDTQLAPLSATRTLAPDLVVHAGEAFQPSRYTVIQGTSSEGDVAGNFYCSETGHETSDLALIPAKLQPIRQLWPVG